LLEMLATLAFRMGPREGVCEEEGAATDCRLLSVVVLAAAVGFGATTLEGRALGVVGDAFDFDTARGVGVGGVGAASEMILAMLVSRMKRPWPGAHVK
jgi:hypothetical protein